MIRAIIELPEIANKCTGRIQSATDVSNYLRRTEYRCLWTSHIPVYVPHMQALELMHYSYAPKSNGK